MIHDVCGFDPVLHHDVQVQRVHIPVIVPPEAVKGDEQQFVCAQTPRGVLEQDPPETERIDTDGERDPITHSAQTAVSQSVDRTGLRFFHLLFY